MTNLVITSLATIVFLAGSSTATPQDAGTDNTLTAAEGFESPAASIDDMTWLAGHWQGQAMGGSFEETWNPPMGGAMMGMFKFLQGDEVGFYEILTIAPVGDSLAVRLKHFTSELHGWEEKDETVDFKLIRMTENEANFDGLTFRRISPSEMHIFVVLNQDDGKSEEMQFVCRRADVAEPQSPPEGQPSESRRSMLHVLEIDRVLAAQRNQMPQTLPPADAIDAYVTGLAAIDFTNCPQDFADAYEKHRQAWAAAIPLLKEHSQLRGELHHLFDQMRQLDPAVGEQLNSHLQSISDTWSDVETTLSRTP